MAHQDQGDADERVAQLAHENQQLREQLEVATSGSAARGTGWVRATAAVVLIALAALIAPIAVVGTWSRVQLVDTDTFVSTFAPLIDEPGVQDLLTTQVTSAIQDKVNISDLIGNTADEAKAKLPAVADAPIDRLAKAAETGAQNLLTSTVRAVVSSEQFAKTWQVALRHAHDRTERLLQGDNDDALQLSEDGTLSIQLQPIVAEVKQRLTERGFPFAAAIPTIDRQVTLVRADAFSTVQAVYNVAITTGFWLPWLVLLMVVAGVLLARHRSTAVMWAGAAFAVSLGLLAAGFGVGRAYFVHTVSPSLMNTAAAEAIFAQIVNAMVATTTALIVLAVILAVTGWLAGRSRPATAVRGFGSSAVGAVRDVGDAHGLSTGAFGRFVERWAKPLRVLVVAAALVVIMLSRPIQAGTLLWILLALVVALLLIELVRRPAAGEPEPAGQVSSPT